MEVSQDRVQLQAHLLDPIYAIAGTVATYGPSLAQARVRDDTLEVLAEC